MGKNPLKKRPANKLTIVILGDGGVGKSSITLKFIKSRVYHSNYSNTTIDDSYTITVKIDDTPWQIEILDTAGQEEYRGLWVDHAISQGDAFIVTYAVNSTKSFRALPAFLNLIANPKSASHGFRHRPDSDTHLVPHPRDYPFPFAIAGNKVDLSEYRAVPTSEAVSLANSTGGLFYECSAKENINIQELFFDLARSVEKLRKAAVVHRQNPTISK
ncbi:hypothetical protein CROQUDRAFT_38337 [Cronartium quercuum f. sp. fusiforme G11]|uniref:Uncharacterized protein n=1 Tax=Cronartium quercuum f. sp. fusiforme G11 TaxID=708437 RepID=A0A9P6NUD7_9BASI|nr:hypothetical protein CROQUDRAFT_38337 [Cronartium quercuum f. sp. fusiforme G11]